MNPQSTTQSAKSWLDAEELGSIDSVEAIGIAMQHLASDGDFDGLAPGERLKKWAEHCVMDLWLALNKEGSKVSGWASQFKQLIDNMASGESGGGHDVSLEAYTQCMREAVRERNRKIGKSVTQPAQRPATGGSVVDAEPMATGIIVKTGTRSMQSLQESIVEVEAEIEKRAARAAELKSLNELSLANRDRSYDPSRRSRTPGAPAPQGPRSAYRWGFSKSGIGEIVLNENAALTSLRGLRRAQAQVAEASKRAQKEMENAWDRAMDSYEDRHKLTDNLTELRKLTDDLYLMDDDIAKLVDGEISVDQVLVNAAVIIRKHEDLIFYFHEENYYHLVPVAARMMFELTTTTEDRRENLFLGGWRNIFRYFPSWDPAVKDSVPDTCTWEAYDKFYQSAD